jgi:hypothetical protein
MTTTTNALGALLATRTRDRGAYDYERMFDDFITRSGGGRVTDRFAIPDRVKNSDYFLPFDDCDLLLELKQISVYRRDDTIDAYFERLIRQGKVRQFTTVSPTQVTIGPESLTAGDWDRFYGKFRPSVSDHLKKAARQLKETDALLPAESHRPRFCGLLLVNSGDYNLPLDLMFRLVEWRTKREWHRGSFSRLDFVSCLTVDLVRAGQHPMQGRHIVRPEPHALLPSVIRRVYENWLTYYADAIGAQVAFDPDAPGPDAPLVLSGAFVGKLGREKSV